MAKSPAMLSRERKLAQRAAANSPHGESVVGSAYELMLAQLVEHQRALKAIQSVERKIEAKRGFLPTYEAWVAAALEHGQGAQDRVLMTLLVWYLDVGEIERGLAVARYAMAHGLTLPDQYERTLPTLLLDEVGGAALAGKLPPEAALQVLQQVAEMTAEHDAPDQARAKLQKAIGYALIGRLWASDVDIARLEVQVAQAALPPLRRALELFEGVGVKKDIERLERRLKTAGTGA